MHVISGAVFALPAGSGAKFRAKYATNKNGKDVHDRDVAQLSECEGACAIESVVMGFQVF